MSPRRASSILALAAICLFATWWRGHTVGSAVQKHLGFCPYPATSASIEPLDCDEAIYGYIGSRMNEGSRLYADLTENKPPLGYWLYAINARIGGREELAVRLMPIPFVLATIVLIHAIATTLIGRGAGLIAGFVYAILSTSPALHGNGANMEQISSTCSRSPRWR